MQRSALAASAPTAVFKPSKWYSYPRIIPTLWTSSLKQRDLCYAHRISCRKDLHRNYLSGSNASNPDSSLVRSKEYRDNFVVRATAVPENLEGNVEPAKLGRTLRLALMFGAWYFLNIYFNIYNKQVLKVFHFPATVTAIQFGCATTSISLMWAFNLYKRPKLTRSQFLAVLPLAIAHTVGNILTNVSLGRVNVSFTHTIKAMEPFFTVVLASLFLGERPTLWVVASLLPIVGGVALSSFTEASFNWIGFSSAMASNLTNQSRNVLSKKLMVKKEESLDNTNLFSVITVMSFVLLVPTAILLEGFKFTPSYLQSLASQGVDIRDLCIRLLLSGFCFQMYQQISYYILGMVNAVTHSVGNCLKRVVVIVSSVIFFRIPVSPVNAFGTAMAIAGVFLYSRVKRIKPKDA